MSDTNLRAAIEAGLGPMTPSPTLDAIRGAFETFVEVADDLSNDGLVWRLKQAMRAVEGRSGDCGGRAMTSAELARVLAALALARFHLARAAYHIRAAKRPPAR
jgi:hypothetical protein